MSLNELKSRLLKLIEEDAEFRYAVAGKLGIVEVLKKLDKLGEGQERLWEGQERLWEGQKRLWENQEKLWENQEKLWKNQEKLWLEVKSLREGQEKLWMEVKSLREGQEKLWKNQAIMIKTLERLSVTVDRLTITVEEEALDVVRHRLKDEMGLNVKLTRIFIDDKEINIYGATDNLYVIGEATVRLGIGLVDELEEKVELVKGKKPELTRPKMIKVIYTDYATPAALEEAKKHKIWVLKWSGDLTPRTTIEQ